MKNACYLLLFLALSACAPSLTTNLLKTYPPQDPDAKVSVYSSTREVPAVSEALGTLQIFDQGASTHCDSVTVFSMAMAEARKAGGNAILITDHRRPSFWSGSCHQIKATILKVSDSPVANIVLPDTLKTYAQDSYGEVVAAAGKTKKERMLPRMTWAFDAGYGWRTAGVNTDQNSYMQSFYKKMDSGFTWNLDGSYFFNDMNGIQLMYQRYAAAHSELSYNEEMNTSGVLGVTEYINYFGAAYVFRGASRNLKWLFDASAGLGYINYRGIVTFPNYGAKSKGGSIGTQFALGAEYMISPIFGIGANIKSTAGLLYKITTDTNGSITTTTFENGEEVGLGQINIMLGIRLHIK